MNTITGYFEQAQLSMSAYAVDLLPGMSGSNQTSIYIDKLKFANMTQEQAEAFASEYSVVDQYTDSATGFSATVFRDASGKTYFSIRGTESPDTTAGIVDWVGTNLADIGRDGIAIHQGIALFNYLQRLYAPADASVVQYNYLLDGTISEYTTMANGLLNTQASPLEVTGHSLGGHLAMMMSRLVPNLVGSVYTYNAPGFDTDVGPQNNPPLTSEGFFNSLQTVQTAPITGVIGSSWNSGIMTHLDVASDFVHQLGFTPGESQTVFSETAQQLIARHDIDAITDSLAVYKLLSRLNPVQSITEYTQILEAGSNQSDNSLENIINALGDVINIGSEVSVGDRQALYTRIALISDHWALQPEYTITSLAGLSAKELVDAVTSSEKGILYALENLNAFALVGDDSLYADLDPADYSKTYLIDRALLLEDKLNRAVNNYPQDGVGAEVSSQEAIYPGDFLHLVDDETVYETRKLNGVNKKDEITLRFGKDNDLTGDPLAGNVGVDHLYGRGGNDALTGGGGNDYLEGGQGNDTYQYASGDGTDTIRDTYGVNTIKLGETTLTGGEGQIPNIWENKDHKDHNVRYQLTTDANGSDTLSIYKTSGTDQGLIMKIEDYDASNYNLTFTQVQNEISTTGPAPTNRTIVGDYADKLFPRDVYGQKFDANGAPVYDADGNPVLIVTGTTMTPSSDDLGNRIQDLSKPQANEDRLNGGADHDHIIGGLLNDELFGNEGNDLLEGGEGNDTLVGYLGDDTLLGGDNDDDLFDGYGSDTVIGGAGNDLILPGTGRYSVIGGVVYAMDGSEVDPDLLIGGSGSDTILSSGGDDILYGDEIAPLDVLLSSTNTIASRGDLLSSGLGNDRLYGGNAEDVLFGGGGSDLLVGSAGNDILKGDEYVFASSREWGFTKQINQNIYTVVSVDVDSAVSNEAASDILYGGAGDDWLFGNGGDDILHGGTENDVLFGEAGKDILFGGDGDDRLNGDEGGLPADQQQSDYLDGGLGNDSLKGNGGDDALWGREGSDKLFGDAGNDALYGGQGSDQLSGGEDNDVLYGGTEGDILRGDAGVDTLYGEQGDDTLLGGVGNDVLDGGADNDEVIGEAGDDTVSGGDGDDIVIGGAGNDILQGGAGQDFLDGGQGADTLIGGAGDDEMRADDDDTVIMRVGDGLDKVLFSGSGGYVEIEGVSLDALTITEVQGTDSGGPGGPGGPGTSGPAFLYLGFGADALAIQNGLFGGSRTYTFNGVTYSHQDIMRRFVPSIDVTGTDNSDTIAGSDNADFIDGGPSGNNQLYGQGGDDYLTTGSGSDTIDGGSGNDTMIGGAGNDTYLVDSSTDSVVENQNEGTDRVRSSASYQLVEHVEALELTGNDAIDGVGNTADNTLQGNAASNTLSGDAGNDIIDGAEGADTLYGGIGDDDLSGGSGDDRISGDGGADTLLGGVGDDTYLLNIGDGEDVIVDTSGYNVIEFGTGITANSLQTERFQNIDGSFYLKVSYGPAADSVIIQNGLSEAVNAFRFADNSELTLASLLGTDPLPLSIHGGFGDDHILGSDDQDAISGQSGDDTLDGAAGNDTLRGGKGNDILLGGSGDDALDGGVGNDQLIGGTGVDRYRVHWGMGSDVITDTDADNILVLSSGTAIADLVVESAGNDLLLTLAGSSDQLVIKDYVLNNLAWTVEADSGSIVELNGLLDQATGGDFIETITAEFKDLTRASIYSNWISQGYKVSGDGQLSLLEIYSRVSYFNTTNFLEVTSNSDLDFIRRSKEGITSTNELLSESVITTGEYVSSARKSLSFSSGGASQSDTFIPIDEFASDLPNIGAVSIDNMVLVYGDTGEVNPLVPGDDGNGLIGLYRPEQSSGGSAGSAWSNTDVQFTQVTFREWVYNRDITLETIEAGDSSNFIETEGPSIVFGGQGNDRILSRDSAKYSGFNYGSFLLGEAGDDRLFGGQLKDWLAGGTGDDYLDGGQGADIYFVGANGSGIDTIDDTGGLPFLVDNEVTTGFTEYSNWFYRNYTGERIYDILPSDYSALPPQIDINDYAAISELVEEGVINKDVVEFENGVAATDLTVSWGQTTTVSTNPYNTDQVRGIHTTLDIALPDGHGVSIVIPHSLDINDYLNTNGRGSAATNAENGLSDYLLSIGQGLGLGIEVFRFGDGTELSMLDMINLAGPAPTFDPQEGDNLVIGTDDNDSHIEGAGGNDVLEGLAGDDRLYGGEGSDVLKGQSGSDHLTGGLGSDTLEGGAGSDAYHFNLGDGVDTLVDLNSNGDANYIFFGPDITQNDIRILRNGFDITIEVGNAGDAIHLQSSDPSAGDNTQTLRGLVFVDEDNGQFIQDDNGVFLGFGQLLDFATNLPPITNTVTGTSGADSLKGSVNNDVITSDAGDDELKGFAGDDQLSGDAGNDMLYGHAGDDVLSGGEGDDILNAGSDDDILYGGVGADILNGQHGDDQLFGGEGIDTLSGGIGNDQLSGGADADILNGYAGDDELRGDTGNDVINGHAGIDMLYGGEGDDILKGGNDADTLYGDVGADLLDGQGSDDLLFGGDGADTLRGGLGDDALHGGQDNDLLKGHAGNDVINGDAGDDILYGHGDDDQLNGGEGNDTLYGGNGLDQLAGGLGDDILRGNANDDVIFGSEGNDVAYGGLDNDEIYGGQGNDTLYGQAGDDLLFGGQDDDTLSGNSGNDTLIGGVGVDRLLGGNDNDELFGGAENDTLSGHAGDDQLFGESANDKLYGGSGVDQLTGGLGDDALYGGTGGDRYFYQRGDGMDRIAENDVTTNTDSLEFAMGVDHDQLWFTQVNNHLQIDVIGTDDRVTINNWYLGAERQVEEILAGDGSVLLNTQVDQLVQAMAGFAPPASGNLELSTDLHTQLDPVLAANWQ